MLLGMSGAAPFPLASLSSCAHLSADKEKELWMRADSLGHLLALLPVSVVEWSGVK